MESLIFARMGRDRMTGLCKRKVVAIVLEKRVWHRIDLSARQSGAGMREES